MNVTNYVTKLEGTQTNTAYEIYERRALATNTTSNVWTRVVSGVTNQTMFTNYAASATNAFYLAASFEDYDQNGVSDAYQWLVNGTDAHTDSDEDGLPDAYETSHGTNPLLADSDTNGMDDNVLTLYFEMDNQSTKPQGHLIRGPGFRVWGDLHASNPGVIWVLFQRTYRGMPLNIWSGDGQPENHEAGIYYPLPAPTGTFTKYLVQYDFRNRRFSVTNSSGVKIHHEISWRDNMTEAFGTNGPGTLWVTNVAWLRNVSYTRAPFPRPVRYVWEGVIGNTSQQPAGPSVHSPWWPILKMVSNGTNVFYTGGYNESKHDIQKFHTTNPQFVVTNFSDPPRKTQGVGERYVTDLAFDPSDPTKLLAKHDDDTIRKYDVATTEDLGTVGTFPSPPSVGFTTNGYGAIALHPTNSNIAALYYTDREQVVVYTNAQSTNPTALFTIGIVNGYSNGPSISIPTNTHDFRTNQLKLCSYHFDGNNARQYRPVVCFQSDGKLWVGDVATSRMLRFDTSGLCDTWFMFVAHSYTGGADPNDPKRVFMGYLEFEVDYNKPLSNSWTLKNYWGRENGAGRPETVRGDNTQNGLFSVVTLAGHGTYALKRDTNQNNARHVVELTFTGLRPTPTTNLFSTAEIEPDGSMFELPRSSTSATLRRWYITNWSGADPVYQPQTIGTINYTTNFHPVYRFVTNGSIAYFFYPAALVEGTTNVPFSGWHLGAAAIGNPGTWIWTNCLTAPLNGRGNFDTNVFPLDQQPSHIHKVIDDNIFFAYRGEQWQRDIGGQRGQANQIFHYKTNGTFIGQFGLPRFLDGPVLNAPGAAGNVHNFSVVKTNGRLYLYTGDEWSHGIHRWRIEP